MPWKQKKGNESKSAATRDKPYWYINVPNGHGYQALSTGTADKKLARRMESMVDSLYRGERRDPAILAWLLDRSLPAGERLKLLNLLSHYDNNALQQLKDSRAARHAAANAPEVIDANDFVEPWFKHVESRSSLDNATRFRKAVRSFVMSDMVFTMEHFNHGELLDWSNSLKEDKDNDGLGLQPETVRRYRAGLLNFIDHLVKEKTLPSNVLATIDPPKSSKPRDRHLTTTDAIRLVEAFGDEANVLLTDIIEYHGIDALELMAYNALLAGAGVEVSVALGLTVRDVDRRLQEVRAPGTKTHSRDRVVRVAKWAWPWILMLLRRKGPNERLFATIPDRWVANDVFRAAIAPLAKAEPNVFDDYWMRDGRHTYAVRAIKAGTPSLVVAKQLGHANSSLVEKVYGVYKPSSTERAHWENQAAERDRKQEKVTVPVVSARGLAAKAKQTPPRMRGARKTRIQWPTVAELLARLKKQSVVVLAKELGVSDVALRKHLLRHGAGSIPDGRRGAVRAPSSTKL